MEGISAYAKTKSLARSLDEATDRSDLLGCGAEQRQSNIAVNTREARFKTHCRLPLLKMRTAIV
jgi:hypothetical protein